MKKHSEILKQAREKSGLSQSELAKKLGYTSAQFVSNWERGVCTIPPKKAALFCRFTGMNPGELKNILMSEASKKVDRLFSLNYKTTTKKQKETSL